MSWTRSLRYEAPLIDPIDSGKPCRVSIVRPNWINSAASAQRERDAGITLAKLEYEEVADVVEMIVDQGPKITITSITLTRSPGRSEARQRAEASPARHDAEGR